MAVERKQLFLGGVLGTIGGGTGIGKHLSRAENVAMGIARTVRQNQIGRLGRRMGRQGHE
jgi:hypothetical protein